MTGRATLIARIEAATGIRIASRDDAHRLAGMFNGYRPDGIGLEELLSEDGIEGEVLARLRLIFAATSSSWDFREWHFVVRLEQSVNDIDAITPAEAFLQAFQVFASNVGVSELSEAIKELSVVSGAPPDAVRNEELPDMMYECLTEFFSLQRDRHDLLILKEAVYSIANDYFLMA